MCFGRHLWAIGIDSDEYHSVLNAADELGPDPSRWQGHILTSMLKKYDRAVYQILEDFALDRFQPGTRVLGLADGALDYLTSGGFIDDLVPQLEALKNRILSGEIVVPTVPTH